MPRGMVRVICWALFAFGVDGGALKDSIDHAKKLQGGVEKADKRARTEDPKFRNDLGEMHEWWCDLKPESRMCAVIKWRKNLTGKNGERLPPPKDAQPPQKPDFEEIHAMHVGWCEGMGAELPADLKAQREKSGPCMMMKRNPRLQKLQEHLASHKRGPGPSGTSGDRHQHQMASPSGAIPLSFSVGQQNT